MIKNTLLLTSLIGSLILLFLFPPLPVIGTILSIGGLIYNNLKIIKLYWKKILSIILVGGLVSGGAILLPSSDPPSADVTAWWSISNNLLVGESEPVMMDINGDGLKEIFIVGQLLVGGSGSTHYARAVCLNGSTGALIWEYNSTWFPYVDPMKPSAIGDLNDDGTYELVYANGAVTKALNCEDGTNFTGWGADGKSDADSGWHKIVIVDTGDTYPYVYTTYHGTEAQYNDGTTKVSKIYGNNGTVAASHPIRYSCYGGVSAADLQGDGSIEILVSDHHTGGGKGIVCFDEDLNLLWHCGGQCECSCNMVVDYNDDGILDVVNINGWSTTDGGICIVDGSTGDPFANRNDSTLGLPMHMTPSIYDIDKDGNLELVTAYGTNGDAVEIWDLTSWTQENTGVTFERQSRPPKFGNVMGDSDLELIVTSSWSGWTRFYNSTWDLQESIAAWGVSVVCVDIDGDGYNNLIFTYNNNTKCYNTTGAVPSPEQISDSPHCGNRRTGAADAGTPFIPANQHIRNDGIDYFTWIGVNCTASDVVSDIDGFDEATEYIAVWNASNTWDGSDALWDKYYQDASGDDFQVHTFDVIMVYLTDTGTQEIEATATIEMSFRNARTRTITKIANNNGYNYTSYYYTGATTLWDVVNNTNLTTGEMLAVWDDTEYKWKAWIVGFSDSSHNIAISRYTTILTLVSNRRYLTID